MHPPLLITHPVFPSWAEGLVTASITITAMVYKAPYRMWQPDSAVRVS